MTCSEEWSFTLPTILREDEGEKFSVSVAMNDVSDFLDYNRQSRTFTFEAETDLKHSVTIIIESQKGVTALYEVIFSFFCPKEFLIDEPEKTDW